MIQRAFLSADVADQFYFQFRHLEADHLHKSLHAGLALPWRDDQFEGHSSRLGPAEHPGMEMRLSLKSRIEAIYGTYNHCLISRFRSGSDGFDWRSENQHRPSSPVCILSFGAARRFRIRHHVKRIPRSFRLEHGTLIIMTGTMQQFWQHDTPRTKRLVDEALHLKFRQIESNLPFTVDDPAYPQPPTGD